jgi:hypothetical protein
MQLIIPNILRTETLIPIEARRDKIESYSAKSISFKLLVLAIISNYLAFILLINLFINNAYFLFLLIPSYCFNKLIKLDVNWHESLIAKKFLENADRSSLTVGLFKSLKEEVKTIIKQPDSYQVNKFVYKTGYTYFDRQYDMILYKISKNILYATTFLLLLMLSMLGVSTYLEVEPTVMISWLFSSR